MTGRAWKMAAKQVAGKIAELFVFNELLKRGAVSYVPLVDEGVDALVRIPSGRVIELQIKSAGGAGGKSPGWFNMGRMKASSSLFIIFVEFTDGEPGSAWVFPKVFFDKYATKSDNGLDLNSGIRKYGMALRDLLCGFRNRWELITHYEHYEALMETTEDLEDLLTMREAMEAPEEEAFTLEEYERPRAAAVPN